MSGGAATFTDKLNSVRIESVKASAPLTAAQAQRVELPKLAQAVKGFQAGTVSSVSRSGGRAVRITYLATAQRNDVTGRIGQDAVERYVFFHGGKDVVLAVGPEGRRQRRSVADDQRLCDVDAMSRPARRRADSSASTMRETTRRSRSRVSRSR